MIRFILPIYGSNLVRRDAEQFCMRAFRGHIKLDQSVHYFVKVAFFIFDHSSYKVKNILMIFQNIRAGCYCKWDMRTQFPFIVLQFPDGFADGVDPCLGLNFPII